MKIFSFLVTLGLILGFTGSALGDAVDEVNMGLSKTSVFDTPTPGNYIYNDAKPGRNDWLPTAWEGLPPQIPHGIEKYLPVVAADNQCLDCHDTPKYIGRPKNTDRKVKNKAPMSRTHNDDDSLETVDNARFTCTQCHVPLSDAPPLVDNTY